MFKKYVYGIGLAALIIGLNGCEGVSGTKNLEFASGENATAVGKLNFYLKDAPSDELQSVFVNIDSIQINYERNGKNKRFEIVNKDSQLVDLMALRDGLALKLKEIPFASGVKIKSLRLLLNSEGNSAVRLDGSVCNLKTPSAQQSGLKVKLSQAIALDSAADYKLFFDFDVDKSIVINSKKCILKPVLKIEALLKNDHQDESGDHSEDEGSDQSGDDQNSSDGDANEDGSSSEDESSNEDGSSDDGAESGESTPDQLDNSGNDGNFDYTDEESLTDMNEESGEEVLLGGSDNSSDESTSDELDSGASGSGEATPDFLNVDGLF